MEPMSARGPHNALVKEQDPESNLDTFAGEAVGVVRSIPLQHAVPLSLRTAPVLSHSEAFGDVETLLARCGEARAGSVVSKHRDATYWSGACRAVQGQDDGLAGAQQGTRGLFETPSSWCAIKMDVSAFTEFGPGSKRDQRTCHLLLPRIVGWHVFPVERAHESRSRLATVVLEGIVFASAAAAPHDEAFAISLSVATTADTFGLHGDGKLIDWLSVVITQ